MWGQGTRVLDRLTETSQIRWLAVSARDCADDMAEKRLVQRHFPVPHRMWSWPSAFVEPVVIRRTRRRVLFCQRLGVGL